MTRKHQEKVAEAADVVLSAAERVALLRDVRWRLEAGCGMAEALEAAVPVRPAAAAAGGGNAEIGRAEAVRGMLLREIEAGPPWRLGVIDAAIGRYDEDVRGLAEADPDTAAGRQALDAVRRRIVAGPPGEDVLARFRARRCRAAA